jgi:putative membrane protein
MRTRPPLRAWVWPPPPVARRLWAVILAASVYCVLVSLLARDLLERLPGWSSEFGLVNGIVLGVLVGVRTRAAFDRWFEGQKLWGEVLIHARNLALKVAHLVRCDAPDRREFAAHAAEFVDALAERLRGADRTPADAAGKMLTQSARWHAAGKIDLPGLWAMEANVRALMDVAGHCDRVAQRPVPASFHALLRHGLLISFVLAPWHLTHVLGLWAVPVQGIIIYFLFGVELTAEEMENPFGTDVDDLPLDDYRQTIASDVAGILAQAEKPPPAPPPAATAVAGSVPTVTDGEG